MILYDQTWATMLQQGQPGVEVFGINAAATADAPLKNLGGFWLVSPKQGDDLLLVSALLLTRERPYIMKLGRQSTD